MSRFKLAFENDIVDGSNSIELDPELQKSIASTKQSVDDDGEAVEQPIEIEEIGSIEEAIAIEELSEDLGSDIAENKRIDDVADNLEDLATIAANIEEPTVNETTLIQTAANMAVAGTDADAASIVPAIESFKNKQLAIEQINQKIAFAREGIMDSVKNIYGKFKEFLKKIFIFTNRMEAKIQEAKKLLETVKQSSVKEVTVKVKSSRFFMKDSKTRVTDSEDYIKSLNESIKIFDKFATAAIKSVSDFNGTVGEYWKTLFNKKAGIDASENLYNSYIEEYVKGVIKLPGLVKIGTEDGVETYESSKLLGNYGLRLTVPKNIPKLEIVAGAVNNVTEAKFAVRMSDIRFSSSSVRPTGEVADSTFELTFDSRKIEQLINAGSAALQVFKKFLNESYKQFSHHAVWWQGPKVNTSITSLHTTLVNKGINNAISISLYAKSYAGNLTSGPIGIALTVLKSSKWNNV